MIGQTISHYRILGKLGEGGMGIVYLAEDTLLGRRVAVKTLTATALHGRQHLRTRFLREARAVSKLSHPNIATVHDYGETEDGQPFIVMELVKGQTLGEMIQAGDLTLARAVEIIGDVAKAIAEAHAQGIIHRDIKPSNIAVNERGEVKVLDFGLAKHLRDEAVTADENVDTQALLATQTREGIILGTPLYLSPEQALGVPVDARSDIFSLGSVLYESIAGRAAFPGLSAIEICAKVIRDDPPPPSESNPVVPPELDRITLKALAKKPEERYQSAAELLEDLQSVRISLHETGRVRLQSATRISSAMSQRARTTISQVLRRPQHLITAFLIALIAGLTAWGLWYYYDYLFQTTRHSAEPIRVYQIGINALQDGTYYTAKNSLEIAIKHDNKFALAHARLAEALTELDMTDRAREEINLAHSIASNQNSLSSLDRLYLEAITDVVGRNYDDAVKKYQEITRQISVDRFAAYIDLGRAYEKKGETAKAIESYQEAINLDKLASAAFLRLGIVSGRQSNREAALNAFEQAETLYRNFGNYEGVTEVLYQRGFFYNRAQKTADARSQLEQALDTARIMRIKHQEIKTLLQLSNVSLTEGKADQAKQYATDAINLATANGMENLATEGLIDLGNTYFIRSQYSDAERYFQQALSFAQKSGGRFNEARAQLSLGSLYVQQERPDDALPLVERALSFYQQVGYSKEVAQALLLKGRAKLLKGEQTDALSILDQGFAQAQQSEDPSELAEAHTEIGFLLAGRELYPQALDNYSESYSAYKSLGDQAHLIYSLTSQGDMLWRLGDTSHARAALKQAAAIANLLDDTAKQKPLSRIYLVQARMALSERKFSAAIAESQKAIEAAGPQSKYTGIEAKAIQGLARVFTGAKSEGLQLCEEAYEAAKSVNDQAFIASILLILSEAQLAANDYQNALTLALQAQENFARLSQPDSEYRSHLIAALASQHLNDTATAHQQRDRADELSSTLQQRWGADNLYSYLKRADVQFYRNRL